jgi:hypothetical protein
MGNGGPGGISTYNLGDLQYLMQGGSEGWAARLAYEEGREMMEDCRLYRYRVGLAGSFLAGSGVSRSPAAAGRLRPRDSRCGRRLLLRR